MPTDIYESAFGPGYEKRMTQEPVEGLSVPSGGEGGSKTAGGLQGGEAAAGVRVSDFLPHIADGYRLPLTETGRVKPGVTPDEKEAARRRPPRAVGGRGDAQALTEAKDVWSGRRQSTTALRDTK